MQIAIIVNDSIHILLMLRHREDQEAEWLSDMYNV